MGDTAGGPEDHSGGAPHRVRRQRRRPGNPAGQLNIAKKSFRSLSAELLINLLPAPEQGRGAAAAGWRNTWAEEPGQEKAMTIGLVALTAALLTASAAQLALNLAVLANPYVAAAAGIIALGVAAVILARKFAFVRRHWQILLIAFGLGPVIVATVVKAIIRHWDSIVGAFNRMKGRSRCDVQAIQAAVAPVVAI